MSERKLVASVLIGNTMEFYDFIVFAFMSKYIASLFFPNSTQLVAYIATFGVFASGYLMRPIGGLVFGYIGDKYGRKKSLSYSIIIITIATFLIGLLPTHASIGILAPLLLTMCRLLQGFSVSGEEGGAAVYLAEMVGANRVAYAGSLVLGSAYFGVLIGSAVCLVLSLIFSADQIIAFAWRIPFFLSVALGIPSLIMRRNLIESREFTNNPKATRNPVAVLLKDNPGKTIIDILMVASLAIPIYVFTIFIPSYLTASIHMDPIVSQVLSVISLIFLSIGVPILGKIADTYGKSKVYLSGCIFNLVAGYPIFLLLSSGDYISVISGILMLGLGLLFVAGPMFALLIANYNPNIRFTAVSFVFNTSMSIFGSVTPLAAFYLIAHFDNVRAPWLLLCAASIIGMLCWTINNRVCLTNWRANDNFTSRSPITTPSS